MKKHSGVRMREHRKRIDLIVLFVFTAATALAVTQIWKIHIDSSIEVFIPKSHEISRVNKEIEKEFGSLDSIMIGVKVNFGSVLEPEVLGLIDRMTAVLEEDPGVERVISLTNTDYIISTNDGMEVVPLLENLSKDAIDTMKTRLVDWQDVYIDTVISSNFKLGVIIVQPVPGLSDDDIHLVYERILQLTDSYTNANLSFPVAGLPVIKREINRSVMTDITFLIPIAAALILGVLLISFRRFEGVLFPLISLLTAGVWTVGLLGLFGITFTMASMLVPVLLLVVGSAYGIHVMSHFYHAVSHAKGRLSYKEVCELVRQSVGNIRLSVILAGATTAGGFISQLSSPLGPFRAFGVLSALGVVFSQISALILIPVLLRLRYRNGIDTDKFHNNKKLEDRTKTPGIFVIFEKLVRRGKWPIALFSLACIVLTAISVPKIRVGTNMIEFFRPDSTISRDTAVFNGQLSGTGTISVMIEAPEKGDILHPSFLKHVETFEYFVKERHKHVAAVQTIVPSLKRINMIMNYDSVPYETIEEEAEAFDFFSGGLFSEPAGFDEADIAAKEIEEDSLTYGGLAGMLQQSLNAAGTDADFSEFVESFLSLRNFEGAAFNELPFDPAKYGLSDDEDLQNLISQYLVLYSGNLDYVINDALEPNKTLITLQLNREDKETINPLLKDIKSFWNYHLDGDWNYSIGGGTTLALILSELVTRSQYYSLAGALLIVWIIVSVMFRSPLAGLIGLIPVAYALLGIFSFMVLLNFSLDIVTSLLAALAIGVGVDYAIHYMNAYKRCLTKGVENPLNEVYKTTGSAILFNAISVAVGFLGLLISRFIPIQQLGILFSVSMVCACLASLVALPMVIEITKPRFLKK